MQIVITQSDLEPIITKAVEAALDRFASQIKEQLSRPQQTPVLLTRKQAAQVYSVSEKTLANREKSGDLIPVRMGGTVRYRREDLDAYVARSKK